MGIVWGKTANTLVAPFGPQVWSAIWAQFRAVVGPGSGRVCVSLENLKEKVGPNCGSIVWGRKQGPKMWTQIVYKQMWTATIDQPWTRA